MNDTTVQIEELKRIYEEKKDGYFFEFERKLEELANSNNPQIISGLIELFDDKAEWDELMFFIVHTIENHDDPTYVEAVIGSMPDFYCRSPRWAMIVHIRILNSKSTLDGYLAALSKCSPEKIEAFKAVMVQVGERSPKLAEKASAVLEKLRNTERQVEQ